MLSFPLGGIYGKVLAWLDLEAWEGVAIGLAVVRRERKADVYSN